jgi:hypothetical protein
MVKAADEHRALEELARSFGTCNKELGMRLLNQALATIPKSENELPNEEKLLVTMSALKGISPRDELEGMLAVQMVAVHNLAMTELRRATHALTTDREQSTTNLAVRLLRTFTDQLEALNRHRGKGQQKVTVEHVHVNSGGQAIVGSIHQQRGRGDGDDRQN